MNHTLWVDYDHRALGTTKDRLDVVKPAHLTAFVCKQTLRQTMVLGESFVRIHRTYGYGNHLRAGALVIGPTVSHAAHLLCTDRSFVFGIENKRYHFAAMVG